MAEFPAVKGAATNHEFRPLSIEDHWYICIPNERVCRTNYSDSIATLECVLVQQHVDPAAESHGGSHKEAIWLGAESSGLHRGGNAFSWLGTGMPAPPSVFRRKNCPARKFLN